MSSARVLRLPASVAADLAGWAETACPAEACGLLVGLDAERAVDVVRATLACNLRAHERADRYEVDPADHLAAWRAAEAEGLEVVGAWHSHPGHSAEPSATDRAEAFPGLVYLIVEVRSRRAGALRAWRLAAGGFVELEVDTPRGPG